VEQQAGARHDNADERAMVDAGHARLQRLAIEALWGLNYRLDEASWLARWLIGLSWVLIGLTVALVVLTATLVPWAKIWTLAGHLLAWVVQR
jgi:hypothetical protein